MLLQYNFAMKIILIWVFFPLDITMSVLWLHVVLLEGFLKFTFGIVMFILSLTRNITIILSFFYNLPFFAVKYFKTMISTLYLTIIAI